MSPRSHQPGCQSTFISSTASFAPTWVNKESNFDTMRCATNLIGGRGAPTPSRVSQARDCRCVIKKLRVKNRSNPWFSSEIAAVLRNTDITWNKACASGLSRDFAVFLSSRNDVSRCNKRHKIPFLWGTQWCDIFIRLLWQSIEVLESK